MIELLFVACLASDPGTCRDHSLLFADTPVMVCMLHGQTQLAQWHATHPQWQIRRWVCRMHDRTSAEI